MQPMEGVTEGGATVQGVGKGGCGCLDLRDDLHGGGPVICDVWFGDVGNETARWESFG